MRTAGRAFLVVFVVAVCASVSAQYWQRAREEAAAAGRKLLNEGRYDEALSAYGHWASHDMGADLLRLSEQARKEGKTKEARALYRTYFELFPFGYLYWNDQRPEWTNAYWGYVAVLEKLPQEERDEGDRQDLAAGESMKALWAIPARKALYEPETQTEIFARAREILRKFPQSHACAGALAVATDMARTRLSRSGEFVGGHRAVPVIQGYLEEMKQAGVPDRSRIIVLHQLGGAASVGTDAGMRATAVQAYLDIRGASRVSYEKRSALLQAARGAATVRADGRDRARGLFREFLKEYPSGDDADEARLGLVQILQIDEALAAVRQMEKEAPKGTDFAPTILEVAEKCFQAREYDKSVALLQEIVERFPASPTAPSAYFCMGDVYEKQGDEGKMVACYKRAAELKQLAKLERSLNAGWSSNAAFERLGNYYKNKKDWAEALKWWEGWTPMGWCGNGLESMASQRAYEIALCKINLGKEDEALDMLEKSIASSDLGSDRPEVAILFVDTYHKQGKLGELERKLDAMERERKPSGVGKAREYLGLLRMAEKKDVGGLWNAMDHGGHPYSHYDWKTMKALEALVSLGGEAKPFIMGRTRTDADAIWACVVLARMKAPEVVPLLREKIRAEVNVWMLCDYFYALALVGTDEAYAIIRESAEKGVDNEKTAATEVLKKYPKP